MALATIHTVMALMDPATVSTRLDRAMGLDIVTTHLDQVTGLDMATTHLDQVTGLDTAPTHLEVMAPDTAMDLVVEYSACSVPSSEWEVTATDTAATAADTEADSADMAAMRMDMADTVTRGTSETMEVMEVLVIPEITSVIQDKIFSPTTVIPTRQHMQMDFRVTTQSMV